MSSKDRPMNWFDNSNPEVGDRVFCAAATWNRNEKTKVFTLGNGVYIGETIPREEHYPELARLQYLVPAIRLDSGDVIYAFECVWLPEVMKDRCLAGFPANYEIIPLSVAVNRANFQRLMPIIISESLFAALDFQCQMETLAGKALINEVLATDPVVTNSPVVPKPDMLN